MRLDPIEVVLAFLSGVVSAIFGVVLWEVKKEWKAGKMDRMWLREQRKMQIRDDWRVK